jgi:hypothetical protein
LAQFEPKQKGALLLRFFQNLALVRGTFWPKLVAHFEPFYPHLIDSAANNHQRMIRLQYNEKLDFPDYQHDNDLWISLQDYQNADWNTTIKMWKYYNLHMIQVIKSVDQTKLDNSWQNFEDNTVTLRQMIEGYLGHIELHLNEIQELIDN